MDSDRLNLLLNTVKHLKIKQIRFQLYYKIRNKLFKKKYHNSLKHSPLPLNWGPIFLNENSFLVDRFSFLNLEHNFHGLIDWNYADYGKLWTYNLNYFDFLNQKTLSVDQGLKLINDYIENDTLKDGLEPYPISLRGINWIKFLSINKISETRIDQALYNDYYRLFDNLEYHLLGNHLLENGFSLLFGSYYFKDEKLYHKAQKILFTELKEQILEDGGHFELSPMYHQILLYRLLDSLNLLKNNPWLSNELLIFLEEKAESMLSWLQIVTYKNGNIPMVNDSTYDIAPKSDRLFEYAKKLDLKWTETKLSDSGYRKFKTNSYELFMDVGNIGPDYQPGHAHSDTLSFELHVKQQPIIVDPGISTYEKNENRLKERQTAYHNTVKINHQEQSNVWDGFRVAQRAKIAKLTEKDNLVSATHNGYKKLGILHTRTFAKNLKTIEIRDIFSKKIENEKVAYFHFHPDIVSIDVIENKRVLINKSVEIQFESKIIKIIKTKYDYCKGFNKTAKAQKLEVYFNQELITKIILKE